MSTNAEADLAIEARAVSKIFRLYQKPSDVLTELFFGRHRAQEFTALDEVSLLVRHGETLGVVGRNGAGKSTLLKLIVGTLTPSFGIIAVHGRIAAILELGSGFHMDFTGRENLYMGGMCLGLTREEIDQRFDSIVEFSELSAYIDQPLRTYSTGMQARLSFSVATSVDPDIMIVDEALSVGDARFQLKCFGRFQEMRRAGKTVLLVSHNMTTITSMCDRAILLEGGRVLEIGEPKHIDMVYHRLLFGAEPPKSADLRESVDTAGRQAESPPTDARFGTGAARIVDVGLIGEDGEFRTLVRSGERCTLFLTFDVREPLDGVVAGFVIRSPRGVDLFGVDTATDPAGHIPCPAEGDRVRVELQLSMWLAAGEYFVTFALARADGLKYDARYDDLLFRVTSTDRIFTTSIVNLDHRFAHEVAALDPEVPATATTDD